ncbi:MAG: YkgJ family cysteine cluster protein [Candidatus Helarchaeota archaeon]
MRKLKSINYLIESIKNPDFKAVFCIFLDIMPFLLLPDNEFKDFSKRLFSLDRRSARPPTSIEMMHFQQLLARIFLDSIMQNAVELYDAIRDLFLTRMTIKASDCLKDCRSVFGCCHGQYTVEQIDHERIIKQGLLTENDFIPSKDKFKLRLLGSIKPHCVALNKDTRTCKIHAYKPMTCTKYPLIPCVHEATNDLTWKGECAHGGTWTSKVSPFITGKIAKLWVKSSLLYNYQKRASQIFESQSVTDQLRPVIQDIICIRRSKNVDDLDVFSLLLKDKYSRAQIDEALKIMKKEGIRG